MPYATPTSPMASPVKEFPTSTASSSRKGWLTPPTYIEDVGFDGEASSSRATGPMPGIPRRQSSSHPSSGHTTPRRGLSPNVSRNPSATYDIPMSKPLEGLPRRTHSAATSVNGIHGRSHHAVPGLPNEGHSSLGLKLHPSPAKPNAPSMQRGAHDSTSSTSTTESDLPLTPSDEPRTLAMTTDEPDISFPPFEPPPPPRRPTLSQPSRSSLSPPARPSAIRRGSSGSGHHRGIGQNGSLQIPFPTSASTSQLAPPGSSPQSLRPASMIRKKSGEVVKPSLKIRSMSTPDLTRQRDNVSEPGTPDTEYRDFPDERSKSVRFADANDDNPGALENVVLFLREQKVTAVGKAADPERAGQITDTETEMDRDSDASDFVQFRTRRNAAARAADEASQFVLEGGSRVPRLRTDFAPDARGCLNGENVILERVELVTTSGPLSLRGSVIVRNISFDKTVSVRFTMDHWQTRSEVTANHVCHIPSSTTGDQGWDRFAFSVKLEDFKRKLEERQLIICVRFAIWDQEFWDSNNGMNYNFTFKKTTPKRTTRSSGPAAFGNGFMRLQDSDVALPGVRTRSPNTGSSNLNKVFGVAPEAAKPTGPKSWVFPKLAATQINDGPARPDSPLTKAPPQAFVVPPAPDVHTHLSLSHWCAPSPPQSPPKVGSAFSAQSPQEENKQLDVFNANEQTSVIGAPYVNGGRPELEHERRSSWNGGRTGSWDSFAQVMEHLEEPNEHASTPKHSRDVSMSSTDGDSTPLANVSRSPLDGVMLSGSRGASGTSSDSSPERSRPLASKRSIGDLRSLLDAAEDGTGLLTPPSSNLSSPPSPTLRNLPRGQHHSHSHGGPLSPDSSSVASTGESSPVNTLSDVSDSATDLTALDGSIDPEVRGRNPMPNYKALNNSYQEFLDKFCFFQSPSMTPMEDAPVNNRPSYIPLSGTASPNGFPFFAHASPHANSPRNTPTPGRMYDSASDAFNFANAIHGHGGDVSGGNGRHQNGLANGNLTPRGSPPITQGHSAADVKNWTQQLHGSSPSLAAQ